MKISKRNSQTFWAQINEHIYVETQFQFYNVNYYIYTL